MPSAFIGCLLQDLLFLGLAPSALTAPVRQEAKTRSGDYSHEM